MQYVYIYVYLYCIYISPSSITRGLCECMVHSEKLTSLWTQMNASSSDLCFANTIVYKMYHGAPCIQRVLWYHVYLTSPTWLVSIGHLSGSTTTRWYDDTHTLTNIWNTTVFLWKTLYPIIYLHHLNTLSNSCRITIRCFVTSYHEMRIYFQVKMGLD